MEHVVTSRPDAAAAVQARTLLLAGQSLSLPFARSQWQHGTWQGIYVCEMEERSGAPIKLIATVHGFPQGDRLHKITVTVPRGVHSVHFKVLKQLSAATAQQPGMSFTMIQHTSAAVTVNTADPAFGEAMESFLNRTVPEKWNREFFEHTDEGPDDMPAHAKCSIVGCVASLPLPVPADEELYVCEHRDVGGWGSGHSRSLVTIVENTDVKKRWTVSVPVVTAGGWQDATAQVSATVADAATATGCHTGVCHVHAAAGALGCVDPSRTTPAALTRALAVAAPAGTDEARSVLAASLALPVADGRLLLSPPLALWLLDAIPKTDSVLLQLTLMGN
eukprot:TRINITY_DN1645_c0_g1_i4.p1 TRINITY_DN1645_c0_g1~~TRINITY_DN1645_c0_g1_i4.p1  ORF type:complete len:334 (-),score=66.29 TRINITY_DN1645_c0_g1_i4:121-1122(-)